MVNQTGAPVIDLVGKFAYLPTDSDGYYHAGEIIGSVSPGVWLVRLRPVIGVVTPERLITTEELVEGDGFLFASESELDEWLSAGDNSEGPRVVEFPKKDEKKDGKNSGDGRDKDGKKDGRE